MKWLRKTFILFVVVVCVGMIVLRGFAPDIWRAIMSHLPVVKHLVLQEFATYTSITNIKETMKLVTARQNLDFITILEGKDGPFINIATFEVKAGIDFDESAEPVVKILSSDKINNIKPWDKDNISFYEEYLKPINEAYQQKSEDYAVELDLLTKAAEKANTLLENLLGRHFDVKDSTSDYFMTVPFDYLPMEFKVSKEFITEQKVRQVKLPDTQFNRDAVSFSAALNSIDWNIRAGYSGMDYSGTFNSFYENVKNTNTNARNENKDKVEIFRHFDPLYPKESEILSYASDYYRTFFLLNHGKIYYIDALCKNDQDRIDTVSPITIYLATSARPITDRNIPNTVEYQQYIRTFYDVAKNIRDDDDPYLLKYNSENLKRFNILNASGKPTVDELYISSLVALKDGSSAEKIPDAEPGAKFFNKISDGYSKIRAKSDCSEENVRTELLQNIIIVNNEIKQQHQNVDILYLPSYLRAWFIQNKATYNISDEEISLYKNDIIREGDLIIRDAVIDLSDVKRNEYYLKLFRQRIVNAAIDVDTAKTAVIKTSEHGSSLYAYVGIDEHNQNDGEILENMIKLNNGKDIFDNKFILIIDTAEYSFLGGVVEDHDYHAFVLDDAYLWIFPNVGSQNILEKAATVVKEGLEKVAEAAANPVVQGYGAVTGNVPVQMLSLFQRKDGTYRPFYFGDWKSLKISGDGLKIGGSFFGTKRLTRSGQRSYRNTNDYQEKSALGLLLADFQHAYSSDEPDYYYDTLCYSVLNQISKYVYDIIFRPTPRMILDRREDAQMRYNY